MIMRKGNALDYTSGPRVITRVLIRGREEYQREGDMSLEAEEDIT